MEKYSGDWYPVFACITCAMSIVAMLGRLPRTIVTVPIRSDAVWKELWSVNSFGGILIVKFLIEELSGPLDNNGFKYRSTVNCCFRFINPSCSTILAKILFGETGSRRRFVPPYWTFHIPFHSLWSQRVFIGDRETWTPCEFHFCKTPDPGSHRPKGRSWPGNKTFQLVIKKSENNSEMKTQYSSISIRRCICRNNSRRPRRSHRLMSLLQIGDWRAHNQRYLTDSSASVVEHQRLMNLNQQFSELLFKKNKNTNLKSINHIKEILLQLGYKTRNGS